MPSTDPAVVAVVAALQQQHAAALLQLAALGPSAVPGPAGGGSGPGDRDGLMKTIDWLEQKLAQLGSPVGGINQPFEIVQRLGPGGRGGWW